MDSTNDETAGSSNTSEPCYTLAEALKVQEDLEDESDAVLGASDDKNCTYSRGYIGRQALYACMTCAPESRADENKRAGVCLACTLKCHEGHELIELYTKRNFRCDCGGKRMPEVRCKLDSLKLDANDLNQYNHNFIGLYCTCKRPFPDPEDTVMDEMIQCAICEDWYHTRHLDTDNVPKEASGYAEMICGGCVGKVDFLKNYVGKIEDGNQTELNDTLEVNVTSLDESNVAETSAINKSETSEDDRNDAKRPKLDICTKPPLVEGDGATYKKGAIFWNDGWRDQLCRCTECMAVYKDLKVEFLLDEKDTVKYYEENGREIRQRELNEQRLSAWNRIGRVQQVEILSGFNLMKERLIEFFDTFVSSRQVVTESDIREFFVKLNKERSEAAVPSHFCH